MIRSKLLRGWWDICRNLIMLICCGILFAMLCVLPFQALSEIGFFSFPFWKLHIVAWWTLFLYVLCVPFWLGFLSLCRWAIRDELVELLTEWKITLTPSDIEYSFGIFRKTVRRIPLTIGLHAAPRNSYRLRRSLWEPRCWDNQNLATDREFAVVLRVGKRYFGEIPCRNTSEVETIAKLIGDFLAKQPKVELSDEDHAALQPDPDIAAENE